MPDADTLVWINRRSSDLARSRDFYAALGFAPDARFSGEDALMVRVSPAIHLMLLPPERFAALAGGRVAAMGETDTLVSISMPSRAAVDAIVEAALAAGGAEVGGVHDEDGYMYGRGLADPDGNGLGVMWMDMEAATRAWGGEG